MVFAPAEYAERGAPAEFAHIKRGGPAEYAEYAHIKRGGPAEYAEYAHIKRGGAAEYAEYAHTKRGDYAESGGSRRIRGEGFPQNSRNTHK